MFTFLRKCLFYSIYIYFDFALKVKASNLLLPNFVNRFGSRVNQLNILMTCTAIELIVCGHRYICFIIVNK